MLSPEERSRRRIEEKVAETQALSDAAWPGKERELRAEYGLRGELKDKEVAARVAENGRKFNEWLLKQDVRERAAIQKKRKELADSFFSSGRAPTMSEAMSMAGEMISEGASLDVELKGSRLKLNEEQLPLIRARVQESQARTARTLQEMNAGIPASAKRTYDVETQAARERLRGINQERAAIQRRLSEGKALPGDYQGELDALDAEETGLSAQVQAARSKALSGGGSRRSTAPAPAGRVSRKNFDKVRAKNPTLAGKSDAEVEAALRAQGVEVY